MSAVTRPIVRYHGGKWKMAPWIMSHFPPHRVYVEPFGGGGSVLLRKRRSWAEVYNDINGEIVNLFRVARDQGQELIRACELTPFSREEYRLTFESSEDPLERARRTLARAFMGFGTNALNARICSGFRTGSILPGGRGAMPSNDWRNYPPALAAIIERLQGVTIENCDAADIIQRYDFPDALYYCDPPYVHETRMIGRNNRHKGYNNEMTDDDHVALARALEGVKGMVLISGYACDLYRELYQGWHQAEFKTYADGSRPRTEVLWMNDRCREALEAQDYGLF